jgi:hypothetical protein
LQRAAAATAARALAFHMVHLCARRFRPRAARDTVRRHEDLSGESKRAAAGTCRELGGRKLLSGVRVEQVALSHLPSPFQKNAVTRQ